MLEWLVGDVKKLQETTFRMQIAPGSRNLKVVWGVITEVIIPFDPI